MLDRLPVDFRLRQLQPAGSLGLRPGARERDRKIHRSLDRIGIFQQGQSGGHVGAVHIDPGR